jgi:hypothetical protein
MMLKTLRGGTSMIIFRRLCLVLLGAALSAPAWAVQSSNNTDGFVDSASITRDVAVSILDFPGDNDRITSICVAISFAKHNGETFVDQGVVPPAGTPYHNEIEFVLTSPEGTSVTLISNDGGTEINADPVESFNSGSAPFYGTINFDQSAANPVNVNLDQPSEGAFQPHPGDLDDFLFENADGTWELFIEDDVGADGLSFHGVTLFLNEGCGTIVAPPATPVPTLGQWASFLLIFLMATGSAVYLRRRSLA